MRTFVIFLALGTAAACSLGSSGQDVPARKSAASPAFTSKKAQPTPAVIAKAQAVLEEHGEKPIGTEIPVTVDGKSYTARIEEHENTSDDPDRPPGKHKGVTIYE